MSNTPDNQSAEDGQPTEPVKPARKSLFPRPDIKINPQDIRDEIEAAIPVVKDRAAQAGELLQTGVRKILPMRSDTPETRYFKILGISLIGLMLVAMLAGVATLLLTLRSPEAVAVPRLTGMDLPEAMEALQEFGLVGHLEQRYFPDPSSKGKIMEQNPAAAVTVRVGRDVTIVLSKGAMVDKTTNYVGRNIEEVKEEIRGLFTGDRPMLSVGDVSFIFDPADAGTIISQDPPPGTTLDKPIALSLLVSRGKDATLKESPVLLGMDWQSAVRELNKSMIPFECSIAPANAEAGPGTVLAQDPAAGQQLKPGQKLHLTLSEPKDIGANMVFGIYESKLAEYAVPVTVTISVVSAGGQTQTLWQFEHPGGSLSFPYLVEAGSELVVSIFGKEFDRQVIKKP